MKKIAIVDGISIYASTNLIRLGSKGKGLPAPEVFGMMPKNKARKIRKALTAAGYTWLAAAPRSVNVK